MRKILLLLPLFGAMLAALPVAQGMYLRVYEPPTQTSFSNLPVLPDTCPDILIKPVIDIACGAGNALAAVRVTGGSGDYQFLWSNGSTDSLQTGLNDGVYGVTVSDNGCEAFGQVDIAIKYASRTLVQTHYGSFEDEPVLNQVASSPDKQYFYSLGRIIFSGGDVDVSFGRQDLWLVKTDKHGQKIWAEVFGGSDIDEGTGLAVATDGTVYVAGNTFSHDGIFNDNTTTARRPFILKINPDGTLLDTIMVPTNFGEEYVGKIAVNQEGAVIIGGSTSENIPPTGTVFHHWLAKMNPDGTWAWSKQYHAGTWLRANVLLSDTVHGGYVFDTDFDGIAPNGYVLIFKVDEQGEEQWQSIDPDIAGNFALAQMPDGGFVFGAQHWLNNGSFPTVGRIDPLGNLDTIIQLPVSHTRYVKTITPNTTGGWDLLLNDNDYIYLNYTEIVSVDADLNPGKSVTVIENQNAVLSYAQAIGRDTFFTVGVGYFGPQKRNDLVFSNSWRLPVHPALIAGGDTIVCPGTSLEFALDSFTGMYGQFTWQLNGAALPNVVQIGALDTVWNVIAQNAAGCYVLGERKVTADKINVDIEVQNSACGLANGVIYLAASNPLFPTTIEWADGGSEPVRAQLPSGQYPFSVSDEICVQHFAPVITNSDAPILSEITQKGYVATWTPGYYSGGEISLLDGGSALQWLGGYVKIDDQPTINLSNLGLGYIHSNRIVVVPGNKFVACLYASDDNPKILVFNHLGSLIATHLLPLTSLVDLAPLPDGGFIGWGFQNGVPPDFTPVLMKLNENYFPEWTKQLTSFQGRDNPINITLLSNGNVAVSSNGLPSGESNNDMLLRVFDLNGNLLLDKKYGGERDDRWLNMKSSPDGGLICLAATNSVTGNLTGTNPSLHGETVNWMFRVNANSGDIEWSQILPASLQPEFAGFSPEGAIVIPSYTIDYSNPPKEVSGECLTAFNPASGDTLWSQITGKYSLQYGRPLCLSNGDILWPHIWYDNYNPGPTNHCCPYADFHLQINKIGNGIVPQPIDLGSDTTLCVGDTLHLSVPNAAGSLIWENYTFGVDRDISAAGLYIAKSGSICPVYDTIRVDYCVYQSLPDSISGCNPVLVQGGMPGLPHAWSNGAQGTTNAISQSGWLTLSVTNYAGQSVKDTVYVEVYPGSNYAFTETDPHCNQGQDGQIVVVPTGEGSPYQYLWNTGATDSLLQNLSAGPYSMTVTDVFGCTFTSAFDLAQPQYWNPSTYFNQETDSTYFIAFSSAVPYQPASFLWSDGSTLPYLIAPPGQYSVTITDGLGCVKSDTILLPPLASATQSPNSARGLKVSPNPFSEWFLVRNVPEKPQKMSLRDPSGRVIPFAGEWLEGENALRISTGACPAGIYSLMLGWDTHMEVCRVVKVE